MGTYPQDFAATPSLEADKFAPWTQGQGACLLEALQHTLADRWVQCERDKGRTIKPQDMLAVGHSQDRTLDAFLSAVSAAERRDLARIPEMRSVL